VQGSEPAAGGSYVVVTLQMSLGESGSQIRSANALQKGRLRRVNGGLAHRGFSRVIPRVHAMGEGCLVRSRPSVIRWVRQEGPGWREISIHRRERRGSGAHVVKPGLSWPPDFAKGPQRQKVLRDSVKASTFTSDVIDILGIDRVLRPSATPFDPHRTKRTRGEVAASAKALEAEDEPLDATGAPEVRLEGGHGRKMPVPARHREVSMSGENAHPLPAEAAVAS